MGFFAGLFESEPLVTVRIKKCFFDNDTLLVGDTAVPYVYCKETTEIFKKYYNQSVEKIYVRKREKPYQRTASGTGETEMVFAMGNKLVHVFAPGGIEFSLGK